LFLTVFPVNQHVHVQYTPSQNTSLGELQMH